jgi:hypothetical protein
MSNQVSLLCLVYGRPFSRAFPVEIGREKMICVLEKVIKEDQSFALDSFAANDLDLWKVDIRDGEELERFEPRDNEVLSPVMKVGDLFQEEPPDGRIHIVVKAPGM